jgi:hypothetical protein
VYVSSEQKSSLLETFFIWAKTVGTNPNMAPWIVYRSLWWYIESGSKLSYCIEGNFTDFNWCKVKVVLCWGRGEQRLPYWGLIVYAHIDMCYWGLTFKENLWSVKDSGHSQQSTHQVRWFRQQVCLRCQYSYTILHKIMFQKMVTFIVTTIKISDLTCEVPIWPFIVLTYQACY